MSEALTRLGYTHREATFLGYAALVGGYFVRSQFNFSLGRECGALAQRFIERAIQYGHVSALATFGSRILYHVSSRALYSVLGDSGNRNRREHRPDTIRRRLMAVDYVIAGGERHWLLSQQAKLIWFRQAGVPEDQLPAATFPGKAKCFFADKQPICVDESGVAEFAFVDDEFRGLSQWELFLKAHRPLLQNLRSTRVVFASCDSGRFSKAEQLFRKLVAGVTSSGGVDQQRLLRYFEMRKLFEGKRYDAFDQARLDDFRENKRVFAGENFDKLFQAWLSQGPVVQESDPRRTTFSSYVLPHSYEWLSPIRFQERRAAKCPSFRRNQKEFEKP